MQMKVRINAETLHELCQYALENKFYNAIQDYLEECGIRTRVDVVTDNTSAKFGLVKVIDSLWQSGVFVYYHEISFWDDLSINHKIPYKDGYYEGEIYDD